MPYTSPATLNASSFSIFKHSLMQTDDLPMADIVDGNLFEQAFEKHEVDFGNDEDVIYTPAITLWALVSQVFFAKEMRSYKTACKRPREQSHPLHHHMLC